MYRRVCIMAGILSMLVGCVTPYVQPEGPDTATLTFKNLARSGVSVSGYNVGADCSGGAVRFSEKKGLLPQQQMEIKVKTNQEFSFVFGYMTPIYRGSKYCTMPSTFTAKQGAKYIARFDADEDRCYVDLVMETDDGEVKDTTFRLRKSRTAFLENGSFCE